MINFRDEQKYKLFYERLFESDVVTQKKKISLHPQTILQYFYKLLMYKFLLGLI